MENIITIEDLEEESFSTCNAIEKHHATAGLDGLMAMMEDLSRLSWFINRVAVDTDEWTSFEACQEYRQQLRDVYDALGEQIEHF